MANKNYTTESRVENYLDKTIEDNSLDDMILSVQEYIEKYTGRNFKADTSASTRLYNGSGNQFLSIDDCIEITKVERGNNQYGDSYTEIDSSDYLTLPINNSQRGVPINEVHLKYLNWYRGLKNNRITAKWGYSENVPEDIKQAATILVANIFEGSSSAGNVTSERIGDYTVKFDSEKKQKQVYQILDHYKKLQI